MIYVMSGSARAFAVIGVTYPEGSTCTCTNGIRTLRARDTSGKALFSVPSAGTWTVTATDGEKTKSVSVEITAEGQCENVKMAYELVLFDASNGGDNASVTGAWSSSSTDGGDMSVINSAMLKVRNGGSPNVGAWYGGTSTLEANNQIDVTQYNECEITVTERLGSANFSVGDAILYNPAVGACVLDISAVSGNVSVKLTASRPGESWGEASLTVTKIVLR